MKSKRDTWIDALSELDERHIEDALDEKVKGHDEKVKTRKIIRIAEYVFAAAAGLLIILLPLQNILRQKNDVGSENPTMADVELSTAELTDSDQSEGTDAPSDEYVNKIHIGDNSYWWGYVTEPVNSQNEIQTAIDEGTFDSVQAAINAGMYIESLEGYRALLKEESVARYTLKIDLEDGSTKECQLTDIFLTAITKFEWFDYDTIRIEGHINPSMDACIVYDLSTNTFTANYGIHFIYGFEKTYFMELRPQFSQMDGTIKERIVSDDGKVIYEAAEGKCIGSMGMCPDESVIGFFEWDMSYDEQAGVSGTYKIIRVSDGRVVYETDDTPAELYGETYMLTRVYEEPEENPTGYPDGEIQQIFVVIGGELYVSADDIRAIEAEELNNMNFIGMISGISNVKMPEKELEASQVLPHAEIYEKKGVYYIYELYNEKDILTRLKKASF